MSMRLASLLLVATFGVASILDADDGALPPLPTFNWNANPCRFPRRCDWVRRESSYYFVSLGAERASLLELLRCARVTGSSTLVLTDWQCEPGAGLAPVKLDAAAWNVTALTRLDRHDEVGGPPGLARLSWDAGAEAGEYLQIDLSPSNALDLKDRPLFALELTSSHAGKPVVLRLLDLAGKQVSYPLEIPEAGKRVRLGPFAPGLDARSGGMDAVRAVRLEKSDTAPANEPITVEVGAILATARKEDLSEPFRPRAELGGREAFAGAIRECRNVGGRVVLEMDAAHLAGDSRLITGGRLRSWVARTPEGAPVFTRGADGRCAFELRPGGGWSEELASAGERLVRAYGIDGVYVTGLDAGACSGGAPDDELAGTGVLLERLRLAVERADRDAAVFAEHADDVTLKFADLACGPAPGELGCFIYATAGLLADIPVRSVADVDELHRVIALGLKLANGPEDLAAALGSPPGRAVAPHVPTGAGAPREEAVGFARYKGRITAARRSCAEFFDWWRGGRFSGRILTGDPASEAYHLTCGREHLYTFVNVADKSAGPFILDVSATRADAFLDVVTGRIHPVQNGCLTLTLEPHALALLRTTVTAASREKLIATTRADE